MMTGETMKTRLSALTGENDENILLTYLDLAADKILSKCYPYNPEKRIVPARYQGVQLEVAVYMLNKRGAEGETSHDENGINRSYESASIPDSMLKDVIPFASAFSVTER